MTLITSQRAVLSILSTDENEKRLDVETNTTIRLFVQIIVGKWNHSAETKVYGHTLFFCNLHIDEHLS